MKGATTLSLLSLFLSVLSLALGDSLVYVQRPNGVDVASFVSQLAHDGVDIRGEHDNFVLAVAKQGTLPGYTCHVIFSNYDSTTTSYFVLERAALQTSPAIKFTDAGIFQQYNNVAVLDKYVFAVARTQEDVFVNQIPSHLVLVLVPRGTLPPPAQPTYKLVATPDPVISNIIAQVSSTDLYDFVTYLTGEASSIMTRQSLSTGVVEAQDYLELKFIEYGFTVSSQQFRSGYSSNVIATLTGTKYPDQLVLVTAHYDSRGPSVMSTTQRAPGANDNGSGTGALLQIAKLISENKLQFAYTVVLMAFSGEEQGLYGSQYAAEEYYYSSTDIIAVLNGDMLAYRRPSEAPQLAFTSRSATASLTKALTNITLTYVNGLTVGMTTGCCTDHSSFYDYGFPATSYFERNGQIADPMYHQSGDLVNREGYDIDGQYPLIVQSMLAGLLTIAEYQ